MLLYILLIALGFALLILGAGWMVNGSSALAKKFNVSDLAIGLTVVAFGTSAPELVVNAMASYNNHDEIVLGNLIGSNLFNLFMILGISGLIAPIVVKRSTIFKEIPISLIAALLVLLMANETFFGESHSINRIEGIILLICFIGFLAYVFSQLKSSGEIDDLGKSRQNWQIALLIILGLAGLVIGGNLVVENAILIATEYGISQKTIGLTIVAAGTSLPELATSAVAAVKKKNDIAVGNVVGSNIFNLLLVMGISSIIDPIDYSLNFNTDMLLLIIGTLMLFAAMFIGSKGRIDRWQAGLLLMIFVGYTVMLIRS
jgi:cation:H+ antiporter